LVSVGLRYITTFLGVILLHVNDKDELDAVAVPVSTLDPVLMLDILVAMVEKAAVEEVLTPLPVIALAIDAFPLLTDVFKLDKSSVEAYSE
jgi:hypothetical protein